MSEKAKEVITRISIILPKLSPEDQAYILGYAECMGNVREKQLAQLADTCKSVGT